MNPLFIRHGTGLVRTSARFLIDGVGTMRPGKVPPQVLRDNVFRFLGCSDSAVLLGPALGQDAAVVRVGEDALIMATDPITGSIEDLGWLVVNVNANDIATFGVAPRWFLLSLIMPDGSSPEDVERVMAQVDAAARELDIAVIGGHTEVTEGIDRPIAVGSMVGLAKNGQYVTSSGARPGDELVLTKSIALEGTAILATEGHTYLGQFLSEDLLAAARALRMSTSVVTDGVVAFSTGHVTAMHDPTEGGLAGGVHEICDASNIGVRIRGESIPIHQATRRICEVLGIDVLCLISSGCMLIAVKRGHSASVTGALQSAGVEATVIGEFVADPAERLISRDGRQEPLPRPETDALWDALAKVTGQETP